MNATIRRPKMHDPIIAVMTKNGAIAAPESHYTPCYACDADAVGVTERWGDSRVADGMKVYACKRHADPKIKVVVCCRYCGDPVRKGSISLGDGMYAHHKCHAEAERADR